MAPHRKISAKSSWFAGKLHNFHVLFCLLILTAACTKIGPDFIRPESSVSLQWLESEDQRVISEKTTVREWWKALNDPTLDGLIEIACEQNLSLRAAGTRIFQARAQLGIAVGELFPQIQQASGGASYNRVSETSASAPQPGVRQGFDFSYGVAQLSVGAAWELDFWGRYRRGIESADANLLAAIAAYDNALVSLLGDVAKTYVLLRTLEERLQIARVNVEIQKESLKIARARYEGGATSERDVEQALTQLYSTESTIPQLEIELQQAKNALSILLGLPPGHIEDLLNTNSGIPIAPIEIAVGIPADLLRRRPDIRYAEYQAAAQCAQIGVAKADLFPMFSLTGSFGFQSSSQGQYELGDLFLWKSRTGSVGPSFQWNILNYGQIANNVRLQDARFQELLVNYQNAVLKAQKEVEDGLVSFLKAQERVVFLARAAEAAKRSAELALIQYREGATDYTTVLTAQQALLAQQDSLAMGQGEVPQGLISVYRALGGGWEIREGREFIPVDTKQAMEQRTDWGKLLESTGGEVVPQRKPGGLLRAPDW